MNTHLYTGLVALHCVSRKAEEDDRRWGEVLVFPNINTDGNHLRPALSNDRTAMLPRARPRDANDSSVGVLSLTDNLGLRTVAAAFEMDPYSVS